MFIFKEEERERKVDEKMGKEMNIAKRTKLENLLCVEQICNI